jgi:hypothetical protein
MKALEVEGIFRDAFDQKLEVIIQLLEDEDISKDDANILINIALQKYINEEIKSDFISGDTAKKSMLFMQYIKYA